MTGVDDYPLCVDCGLEHTPEQRRRIAARMVPCTSADLLVEYPCLFRDAKMACRVLTAIGAERSGGPGSEWRMP